MKTASIMLVGSLFVGAIVAAGSCGGDDSSGGGTTSAGTAGSTTSSAGAAGSGTGSTTSAGTAGSTTSTGAAGNSTGAAGSGTGGSTTGSGGSGSSDAGNGCPGSQPAAGTPCNIDRDCPYGTSTCSCIDLMWSCNATPPPSDAGGCPPAADQPGTGDPCSTDGLVCGYPPITCTCRLPEWDCTI
jgi:hypothetical protein